MIVKMTKYTFVVLAAQKDGFLERLQELGMVDVTSTGWEPTEVDRALMALAEKHRAAVEYLRSLKASKEFTLKGKPFGTGAEAFDRYEAARREIAEVEADIARYRKLLEEAAPFGDFDPQTIRELESYGVSAEFLLKASGFDVASHDFRLPEEGPAEMRAKIAALESEHKSWNRVLADAVASIPAIEAEERMLVDQIEFSRSRESGVAAADGSLVVMNAWAREKQAAEVDAMLETHSGVLYIKERPTPEDETPVELQNNSFASPFEFIGNLYAKPKYGTMDLTRWFAPFFMLFFGMCMADFGYGTILFLGGLALALTSPKESMKQVGRLTMWCGGAAMVVGFIMGGLFGTSLAEWKIFQPIKNIFIGSDAMFYVAIGVGIFQVMFAMVLNIVMTTRAFGIKYALATIGWFVVLAACIASFGLQTLGVEGFGEGGMFAPWSTAFYSCVGAGLFLMLFFNSPGKNPLVNFGAGLWAMFNRLTGLLGDALSYIRLFAIGLAGGILGQVFNTIAIEISPDVPVLGQAVTLLILLIGHGLNLFLSTLSAIVHPLRLTFVEFFNNAGFEATERIFQPLKRSVNEHNSTNNN